MTQKAAKQKKKKTILRNAIVIAAIISAIAVIVTTLIENIPEIVKMVDDGLWQDKSSGCRIVVQSITAMPESVAIDEFTTITVSANDPDGKSLTYIWSATHGKFFNDDEEMVGPVPYSTVSFQAPNFTADVTVTVTVKNQKCAVEQKIAIPVSGK